jgi:hypothetical protein
MKNPKLPLIVAAVLAVIVLIGGGVFAFSRMRGTADPGTQEQAKKKKAEPVNVIAVADRPYLKIVPAADGRNITLVVESLKKAATEVEYELEYQAGTQLQGAFGVIELAKLPAEFKILLGSCSAGGACSYHEDVKGGTLLTKFSGPENYALKSDWKYIDNRSKETAVSSTDAKFQLESKDLATLRHLIIFNTAGYPDGLTGTPVSDPYSLTASGDLDGNATLTMRANEEGNFTIMGWDGSAWKSFPAAADGKSATAEVQLMELYILVKK